MLESDSAGAEATIIEDPLGSEMVEVNWIEEVLEGAITMICLALLSIALLAFLIQRFGTLRPKKIVPPDLISKI